MKNKKRVRAVMRGSITLKDLEQLAKSKERAKERAEGLLPKDIELAAEVFQWRQEGTDILAREQLVRDCVAFLNKHGGKRPLEPLLVYGVGPTFFLVDGHHRLDAYAAVKWKGRVPVEYFKGSLKDALGEAIKRNSAAKLRLTDADKMESAWRMLKQARANEADWTWNEITALTGVSRKSVHRMSQCLTKYGSRAEDLPWMRARRIAFAEQLADDEERGRPDEWKQRRIQRIADHLRKGPSLTKDPEFTAGALEAISPLLPQALAGEWMEHALQQFREIVRIDLPEKAQALEDVMEAWERVYFYGGTDDDQDDETDL